MEENNDILVLKQNENNHDYVYIIAHEDSNKKFDDVKDMGSVEDLHSLMELIETNNIKSIRTENAGEVEVN